MTNHYIIIFDGLCNFCNGSVNFIINYDPQGVFHYVPMQCNLAQELIAKYKMQEFGADTFVLIKNDTAYVRTDAALEIVKNLTGLWFLFGVFKVVPRLIRDYVYTIFAKNRYKLFGKREVCMIPTPEVKSRFFE